VSLIAELQRRNVFRVGAAYLALGWIVAQVTALVTPALHLPESILSTVVWIGVIGFPFVLLFAWAYELTPEGLKREHAVDRSQSITQHTARRLDTIVIAMLAIAIGLFVFDRFAPRDDAGAGNNNGPRDSSSAADDRGHGPLPQQQSTPAPAATTDNSIAVLPFADMSQGKDQEYFSDGLAEELLNLLAQIPELRVTARTSSFSFKGKDVDIAAIAKALNVAHVLEGSVRRSGNTVRITAQLVRASDSTHLWSKSYDREMTDIFKVQDEIAGEVVGALRLKLLPGGSKTETASTEAYNKFLLGRQYNERSSPEGWTLAKVALEEAIALDPGYAAAYAGLAEAEAYAADYEPTVQAIDAGKERALAAAERAIELAPEFADGYSARGYMRYSFRWDWAAAQADFERAVQLDPADATMWRRYSQLLGNRGREEEAIASMRRATELDPLSAPAWHSFGFILLQHGDHAPAREALERALAINPDYDYALMTLATLDIVQGNPRQALERVQRTTAIWRLYGTALAQHSLGDHAASRRALDELEQKHADGWAYQVAVIHAWRGDADQAFAWLERARAQHDGALVFTMRDPLLQSLRDDPRFAAFLATIGLSL
jgi:TolB-like protein/Tfp pilus assembly protein PilF